MSVPNRGKRIMISCDFGTTFTGVAYSNPVKETDEPVLLTKWGRLTKDKCPSIVSYDTKKAPGYKWGPEVRQLEKRQEWFKLGIEGLKYAASSTVDMSRKYPSTLEEAPHYNKKAKDIAIDFLTSVRKHVIKELAVRYTETTLNTLRQEWIITVPAIWSPTAKNTTKEIALAAGMGKSDTLQITTEPEAAATFTLRSLDPHDVKINDNVVICDAGGGTVDLVSYRVKKLNPHLEVEESGIPTGGKCGSVFLNRIFEKTVEDKLAAGGVTLTSEARTAMLRHFEDYTKKEFQGDEDDDEEEIYFPVPTLPDNRRLGISSGRMAVTAPELRKMFDEVIGEIVKLVREQINGIKGTEKQKKVKAILLVGGFGENYYLKSCLEETFPDIEVLVPPNAWTAIARGAVMKGLAKYSQAPALQVTNRVSQGSYGTSVYITYEDNNPKHKGRPTWFCNLENTYNVNGSMDWFIERGDNLSEKSSAKFDVYCNVPAVPNANFVNTSTVYHSFAEKAPDWNDDPTVYKLAKIQSDFSKYPTFKFETKTGGNGQDYYKINFTIHARFFDAHMEVWTEFQGEMVNNTRVNYLDTESGTANR